MTTEANFQPDIDAVESIAAVPTILSVVCRTTGMGFAAVARVTEQRWICLASKDGIGFGLAAGGELKVESTICHEIRQNRTEVVIDHVAEDPTYRGHHTPAMYGFQSYISMPIFLKDGTFYGTLCAIDPNPARLKNPVIIGMFRDFAELIAGQIEIAKRALSAEVNLLNAREAAGLREQFIAAIGHDLRNPIAAIAAGMQLLQRARLDDRSRMIVEMAGKSVGRVISLIDDVTDLARAHLGGGIVLARSSEAIEPVLRQIIDEMRVAFPERTIETVFDITRPVSVDRGRLARLLSNLLGNALAYGAAGTPVQVRATTHDAFELSVVNEGPDIPPATMKCLFAPFTRGEGRTDQKGLGLGLYIVAEIARAHGGSIDVTSAGGRTCFTFRMPLEG